MRTLTIKRPSDFHTHLRSPAQVGQQLFDLIVRKNCAHYAYVVVEPNTFLDEHNKGHHIENASDVHRYRDLVTKALPADSICMPLFLIKLTPKTTPAIIREAKAAGAIGLKLYPEGVTTGSEHGGISDFFSPQMLDCIACVQEEKLIFQVHPEQPGEFCTRREHKFHATLTEYTKRFPALRMFVEHITDRRTLKLLDWLHLYGSRSVYGTITGHHLKLTLDDVLGRVDHHCWPCAKEPEDRSSLVLYALEAAPYIISITDSAPHEYATKHERECACAGVFNPAEISIPWLVSVFDHDGKVHERLDALERFTSGNGCSAYGLTQSPDDTITLIEEEWIVPQSFDTGTEKVTPFLAGKPLKWKIVDS